MNPDFPDTDEAVIDFLTERLTLEFPGVTVGVMVPDQWRQGEGPPHVLVATDTVTETHAWQRPGAAAMEATVRVTAWADTLMEAKHLARVAHAHLMHFPGRPALGVTADIDPMVRAPIASFTAVLTFRPTIAA